MCFGLCFLMDVKMFKYFVVFFFLCCCITCLIVAILCGNVVYIQNSKYCCFFFISYLPAQVLENLAPFFIQSTTFLLPVHLPCLPLCQYYTCLVLIIVYYCLFASRDLKYFFCQNRYVSAVTNSNKGSYITDWNKTKLWQLYFL